MKIATAPASEAILGGAKSAPRTFDILAGPEAFILLSSGLYTNKIRAIIRELSCNAWDAHVAAGNTHVPFELHLPTVMEPHFAINDFGTGLEYIAGGCAQCDGTGNNVVLDVLGEEEIEPCPECNGTGAYDAVRELYCTYFGSNKSTSNLFIGALGLGSKSPFCYTDGFAIINRYAGATRVYSCYKDGQNLPAVLLQSETATPDAPAGVEVNFPVKQNDIWEFENQAKVALEFFDPMPVVNLPNFMPQQAEYVVRTERWGLRKEEGKTPKPPRAIQGMVQYGIGEIDSSRLTAEQRRVLSLPLDLFFPIGELSVAANRESLSNDTRTVNNMLAAIGGIRDGMVKDVARQLGLCQTMWEAQLLLYKLKATKGIDNIIQEAHRTGAFDDVNSKFTLKSQTIRINQLNFPELAVYQFGSRLGGRGDFNVGKTHLTKVLTDDTDVEDITKFDIRISVSPGMVFVVNDVGLGTEKYIKHLRKVEHMSVGAVIYITRANKHVSYADVPEAAKHIIERLGHPPVILMSQLVAKYKYEVRTDRVTSTRRDVVKMGPGTRSWQSLWSDGTYTANNIKGLKFYVPIKKLVPQVDMISGPHNLYSFWAQACQDQCLAATGVPKFADLFGVRVADVPTLDDTWVNAVDYVTENVLAYMTPEKEEQLRLHLGQSGFSTGMAPVWQLAAQTKPLPADHVMQQFADAYTKCKQASVEMSNLHNLLKWMERAKLYEMPSAQQIDLYAMRRAMWDKYPLLECVSGSGKYLLPLMVQYVNFIDNKHQPTTGATFASPELVQPETKEQPNAN